MDKRRVELRVADIVDHVVSGGQIEDDYVECKRDWPSDHRKAARQIAGLCNAARGEDVLWIVGLDEDGHCVSPLTDTEHSNWWGQIRRCFAELAPELDTLTVPTTSGKRVVALVFTTDRSPYVVTTPNAGPVHREVPWRESNSTDSATRAQLLHLLVENAAVPAIEFITPLVKFDKAPSPRGGSLLKFTSEVFISVADPVMLPRHLWSILIQSTEWEAKRLSALSPELEVRGEGAQVVVDAAGIHLAGSALLAVDARIPSDAARSKGWTDEHLRNASLQSALTVTVDMPIDRQNRSAHASIELQHYPQQSSTALTTWKK